MVCVVVVVYFYNKHAYFTYTQLLFLFTCECFSDRSELFVDIYNAILMSFEFP